MKKRNTIVLMISFSLVLLLGSSYALLRSREVGSNPYVINVGTLQVTFEDDSTEKLSLENMYPMSDKEGMSQSKELGFVVKNTGDMEARYNVYLEETSTNPEFKNHIRFISNKNNQGYNEPKTMGYDRYIDLGARLNSEANDSASATASYKVKIWLDQDADNTYMDKTFTAKVIVESNQIDPSNTLYTKINNAIQEHPGTTIEEDDVTYLSGSNDDVNYNYVWYSGKLWRITSINQDGTIKMMTEDSISIVKFDTKEVFYSENTEMYHWLNEDFLDSLYNYRNLLVDAKWYSNQELSKTSPTNPTKVSDAKIVTGYVGGLTAYEYFKSSENTSEDVESFSYNKSLFWLITTGETLPYIVSRNSYDISNLVLDRGIRPVIVFKDNIEISGGAGTIDNPYTILGDRGTKANDKLNSRVSGEYVKFDNTLYRIIDIEDNKTTKLTMNNNLKDSKGNFIKKAFGTSLYYGDNTSIDYWNGYLNQTWYNSITEKYRNMMVVGTYYLGSNGHGLGNKASVCKDWKTKDTIKTCEKVDKIWVGYVGLLRSFELFAAQLDKSMTNNNDNPDNFIATLTPSTITSRKAMMVIVPGNRSISYTYEEEGNIDIPYPTRPSITLSSKVIITSGKGTFEEPFEIELPS